MPDSAQTIAGRIAALEQQVRVLSRASQIAHSSIQVPDPDGGTTDMLVPDAIGANTQLSQALQTAMADVDAAQADLAQSQIDLADQLHTAQAGLDEAQANIDAAQAAIEDLQNNPGGAATVTYSLNDPSGTASDGTLWYKVDATGQLLGQWQYVADETVDPHGWVARQITSDVLAGVDLSKLVSGGSGPSQVVAQSIAAATAAIQTVDVGNLFVTENATLAQAVVQKLWTDVFIANIVQAQKVITSQALVDELVGKIITAAVVNGGLVNGATVQTSSGDGRVVLANDEISFYYGGTRAGLIESAAGGAGGGIVVIQGGIGSISIGTINLPSGGTSQVRVDGVLAALNGLVVSNIQRYGLYPYNYPMVGAYQYSLNLGTSNVLHTYALPSGKFQTAPIFSVQPATSVPENVPLAPWSSTTASVSYYGHRTDATTNTAINIIAVET